MVHLGTRSRLLARLWLLTEPCQAEIEDQMEVMRKCRPHLRGEKEESLKIAAREMILRERQWDAELAPLLREIRRSEIFSAKDFNIRIRTCAQ